MGPHRRNSHDDNLPGSSLGQDQVGLKFDRTNGPWPCCFPKGCLYHNGSNAEHILITGIGTVNADRFGPDRSGVAVAAYDYTVLAGTQGWTNHHKKDRLFRLAWDRRLPVGVFAEGGGGRPGETDVVGGSWLDAEAFALFARLVGHVPTVSVVHGRCFAGNAALAGAAPAGPSGRYQVRARQRAAATSSSNTFSARMPARPPSTTASWNEAATSSVRTSAFLRTWLTTDVFTPENEKSYGRS